jgi:glucose dehydrogenase
MSLNSILEALRVRTNFLTSASRRLSLSALSAILGLALLPASLVGFASTHADIITYHNNAQRTGWNATERTLTARNVGSSEFRLLQSVSLDDQVDAQPLIVTQQTIKDQKHDVVYVATENDTIYAIDTLTGDVLLSTHFGTPVPMSALPGNCNNNANHIGINSTPVIDTAAGTMYVIIYTFESNAPVFASMRSISRI